MNKYKSLSVFVFLSFLSGCAFAESGFCKEPNGYIERDGLIRLVDADCSDYKDDGLCSLLLGVPLEYENRKFIVFTFTRTVDSKIESYLNLNYAVVNGSARTSFEVAEKILSEIEITAVYQNIEGCTLRSNFSLGKIPNL